MENVLKWKFIQTYFKDYVPSIPAMKIKYNPNSDINSVRKYERLSTTVKLIKEDTLAVAERCDRPLVLILADARVPGGCVPCGNGMQEESLFRRTALFKHLLPSLYPIEDDAAIYAPNVEVLDNGYMDFIACPGIKMPQLENNRLLPEGEQRLIIKIRTIFQIAKKFNHDTLVLGAIGCGVWGCPTKHVAEIFQKIINEFDGQIRNVTFAILGANYNMFVDVFSNS
jgi:uncharacterized protein (TIGR02452 family)